MQLQSYSDVLNDFVTIVYNELNLQSKKPNIIFEKSGRLNVTHNFNKNYIKFCGAWDVNDFFKFKDIRSQTVRICNPFIAICHELLHRKQHEEGVLEDIQNNEGKTIGKKFNNIIYSAEDIHEMLCNNSYPPWEYPVIEQEYDLFLKCAKAAQKSNIDLRAYFPKGIL